MGTSTEAAEREFATGADSEGAADLVAEALDTLAQEPVLEQKLLAAEAENRRLKEQLAGLARSSKRRQRGGPRE